MPHGYSFLDDDLSAEPKEKEFDHHENENVVLPRTHEEVLQNLAKHPEAVSQHFVESEAIKHGVDFDDKNAQIEPKGYPDSFKSEEEEKTSE